MEIQADNDVEILLSSAFDDVSTNRAQVPLDTPTILSLANAGTTQVLMRMIGVLNTRSYQVQTAMTVNGPWLEAAIFPSTKGVIITSLTSGTVYTVRVRAIGGSTQYSDWSLMLSLMAT